MTPDALTDRLDDAPALEALYRSAPDEFAAALPDAMEARPESPVLAVWRARLDADGALAAQTAATERTETTSAGWVWAANLSDATKTRLVWLVVALVGVAGLWLKLPHLLGWDLGPNPAYQRESDFHQRFAPFYAGLPLLILLAARYRPDRRVLAAVGGIVAALLALQAFRPAGNDVFWLSVVHVSVLLLSLGGAVALGSRWRETEGRMGYLQLVGESVALAGLFLLGGGVLVGITAALFSAIDVDVQPLFEWVVPFGALGVLPVGALMAGLRTGNARVAPLVARVFGPLALAVFAIYLPTLLISGELQERDTLLSLNVALLAVLALVILTEAERPDVRRHWTDFVAAGLVVLALAADVAALFSIAERLFEGGLTPNRLAVVGVNVLVAVHLAGLSVPLVRRAVGSDRPFVDRWTARFLGVYAVWGLVVVTVFPLLFRD